MLMPPATETTFLAEEVANLGCRRMHIELNFRVKPGVRGLRLEGDIAPRSGRLLGILTVLCVLTVLLGPEQTARLCGAAPEMALVAL